MAGECRVVSVSVYYCQPAGGRAQLGDGEPPHIDMELGVKLSLKGSF